MGPPETEAPSYARCFGPMSRYQKMKLGRVMAVAVAIYLLGLVYFMRDHLPALPSPPPSPPKSSNVPSSHKVAKVSMLYGPKNSLYERAIQSHERHAARWGYPMLVLRQDIAAGFWNKPTYLLTAVVNELSKPADERIEWMMWVDADSIIINPAIPADMFLPPADMPDIHVVASRDHNGLNTGIIFLRVHPWTVTMLAETIGYPLHHPGVDLGRNADQDVMAGIFNKSDGGPDGAGYARAVVYMPRPLTNAYEFSTGFEGDKGSLLVHFPGLDDLRWPRMERWLDTVEKTPLEWEVPLERTGYVNQTDVFWGQVRAARRAIASTEKGLASLEGEAGLVDDLKRALGLLRAVLRDEADDLELMRRRLDEMHGLHRAVGWETD
ncbi:galactosyl transferase GMA12/MNN10 family protein, partial [Metarhizium brunneum ARSEF 3297]